MRLTFLLLLLLIILLGVGCQSSHQPEQKEKPSPSREMQSEQKAANETNKKQELVPFDIQESLFHSVADWKDEETIFYITNGGNGSTIHTYNLFSGESTIFFESEAPIVQFEANADQSLFFVHTSLSSNEAEIFFLDPKGKAVFTTKLDAFELQYTWNPHSPELIFISSFQEDWTYQTYFINAINQTIVKNPVDHPFIQWVTDKQISLIKWDQEAPSITAPLTIQNLVTQEEQLLTDHAVANTNFKNAISAIEVIDEFGGAAVKFYDRKTKELFSEMPTRLVALYSEWSIPYHDMDQERGIFYMNEVNEAKTSFSLVVFDLKTKEKKTIIDNIENLPVKLSPDGEYALFGARYEQIISIDQRKTDQLVIFK